MRGLLALLALSVGLVAPLNSAAVPQEPPVHISIGDATVTEGSSGTVNATFDVTLSQISSQTVTVDYATADGTATAPDDYLPAVGSLIFSPGETTQQVTVLVNGDTVDEVNERFYINLSNPANGTATAPDDYLAASGTLTFQPGRTTRPVAVTVNGDTIDEEDETYFVNLSSPVNATIVDGQGLGTITDDDGFPALSIGDATVTEGNSGTVNATFTVTLSPASGQTVSVDYATADGTATAPDDYLATGGNLVFEPGQTTRTVEVTVNCDTLDEIDETFTTNLSNSVNATIADGLGLGTIIDDDGPEISIDDVTVTEGDSGTVTASFLVSLTAFSPETVSVDYATADGSATAPDDYLATGGNLAFDPGQTTRTVEVTVNGDTLYEPDETFFVNLSNAVNAHIGDGQGQGTITNDDAPPP